MVGYIGFGFILSYIALNLEQEHFASKLLFLMTSFISMILGTRVMRVILDTNGADAGAIAATDIFYYTLIVVTSLLCLYLFWYMFHNLFKMIPEKFREVTKNK